MASVLLLLDGLLPNVMPPPDDDLRGSNPERDCEGAGAALGSAFCWKERSISRWES
jgi:hypothetical protein